MASKFAIVCLTITLFSFIVPSLAGGDYGPPQPPTKNVTQDDIDKICSKALDQQNCLATISAIPASTRTDLLALTKAVLDEVTKQATNGYNAIQSMITSTSEPELKDAFEMCAQHYYNAREEYRSCTFSLNAPVFYLINVHILLDLPKNAILEVRVCEMDLLQAQKNSPVTPLTNTNNKMIIASNLVEVVGTYLYESYKSAGY